MMTTKEKKMMKKKEVSAIVGLGIVILMVILGEVPHMAEGVTCSPTELAPCLGAISSSSPPSTTCCQKVMEQKPCLCGYLRDPSLSLYVNTPGARKVAASCGVPFPTC